MIVDNACGSVHGHAHEHTISLHLPKAYELVDRDSVPMKKRNVQDSQHSSQLKQHLIKKKNGDIKIKPRKYIWTKGLIKGQREREEQDGRGAREVYRLTNSWVDC